MLHCVVVSHVHFQLWRAITVDGRVGPRHFLRRLDVVCWKAAESFVDHWVFGTHSSLGHGLFPHSSYVFNFTLVLLVSYQDVLMAFFILNCINGLPT